MPMTRPRRKVQIRDLNRAITTVAAKAKSLRHEPPMGNVPTMGDNSRSENELNWTRMRRNWRNDGKMPIRNGSNIFGRF